MSSKALCEAFANRVFARATDWVVEFCPSVQFRYTCLECRAFPVRSREFIPVSELDGLGGSISSGHWH
eukprot:1265544-Lingulodinium_polyedra.AAC.1